MYKPKHLKGNLLSVFPIRLFILLCIILAHFYLLYIIFYINIHIFKYILAIITQSGHLSISSYEIFESLFKTVAVTSHSRVRLHFAAR